jgi:hypothetical protein
MNATTELLVKRWFDGLNSGNLSELLPLFGPSPRIRNAANPPLEGPDAPRHLLEEFFRRTTARHFQLIDMAEDDGHVFACWLGTLTFAAGISIGDILLPEPLTVTLRGVERFQLEAGRIVQMDIVHETTTVYQAALAASTKRKGV